jgi:hypothetical protein
MFIEVSNFSAGGVRFVKAADISQIFRTHGNPAESPPLPPSTIIVVRDQYVNVSEDVAPIRAMMKVALANPDSDYVSLDKNGDAVILNFF